MKKLLSVLLVAVSMFIFAGPAFADIDEGNIIAVFYNENDVCVSFDLGAADEIKGTNVTFDTSVLSDYFTFTEDFTYEDISVGIFGGDTEAYSFYWATTSVEATSINTTGYTNFKSGLTKMYYLDDGGSVDSAANGSYDTVMNKNSNSPGCYGGINDSWKIGEADLDADGNFTMYVHNIGIVDMALAEVAENMITVSSVPVPGAVWLLCTGLLGALGVRRKKA